MFPFFGNANNYSFNISNNEYYCFQDKSLLIKKIKQKINALEQKRTRLKSLKRWSDNDELTHQKKIKTYQDNLKKLGASTEIKLTPKQIILKLQKQLKTLNNSRVNKTSTSSWTKEDNIRYEKKAKLLIDSIIKLRMLKN